MLAVIEGEAGVGKTTLSAFYLKRAMVFTPDKGRLLRTYQKVGRTGDVVIEVQDLETLCDRLVHPKAKAWPGITVVEDYGPMCARFLDLIATTERVDESGAHVGIERIKAERDHFGSLSRFSKAAMHILSGRHSLVFTHLSDMPEGGLGPDAGTKPSGAYMARVASEVLYLKKADVAVGDPVQSYKTRVVLDDENVITKSTQVPEGVHPPFLPLFLPSYCETKPKYLSANLEALGQRLTEVQGSERKALLRKAQAKGLSKELISLAFQYACWKDYEPEILL